MSLKQPRFRRDLEAVPVEAEGQSYVDVRDRSMGESFRFYDFEYRVALAFDGLPLEKVIPWVKMSTGMELQVDQLQAFAERLEEMGFLEGEANLEGEADPFAAAEAPALEDPAASLVTQETASCASSQSEIVSALAAIADRADTAVADALDLHRDVAKEATTAPPDEQGIEPEGDMPRAAGTDSTAFPVLPAPAPRVPTLDAISASRPSPRAAPWPVMTPVPVTFGPSLIAEQPLSRGRRRRSLVLFGSLGILAAMAILAMVMLFLFPTHRPSRPRVKTLVAAPGTIFRHFDGTGIIEAVPGQMLKFPAAGKVSHIVGKGSTLASGDVAAAVEAARSLQNQLTQQRERLAFFQQMAEAMHQVGNTKEEERQVAKVEVRNAKIAETLRALADVAVVVTAPGKVEEIFAREGDMVEANSPALRLHATGFRATFELPRNQVAQARRLAFCQVEAEGYVFDCIQSQASSDESHVSVETESIPTSLVGKAAHLARARWSAAIVVPTAAIVRTGNRDEVFVVAPQGRVEPRPVTVAERDDDTAIVVQGLDMGDNIVIEATPNLRAGVQVTMVP
jgi:multidrug efflux pump subunit AcrA (membrane-fusion protein)